MYDTGHRAVTSHLAGGSTNIFDPKRGFLVFCPHSVPQMGHETNENIQKTGFALLRTHAHNAPNAPSPMYLRARVQYLDKYQATERAE